MRSDVRSYYGFSKDFYQAGYFETQQSQRIVNDLAHEIRAGKLVALCGIIGSGKTTMLRYITVRWSRTTKSWYPSRSQWTKASSLCQC
jgi:type II secretory pathway predicted ATPase ExeA